jgi:hypothetical protein
MPRRCSGGLPRSSGIPWLHGRLGWGIAVVNGTPDKGVSFVSCDAGPQ